MNFFEHKVFYQAAGDVLVQRLRVGREFLAGNKSGVDDLLIQIVHGLHDLQAEADDRMAVFRADRYHPLGPKRVAVHDKGLNDLRHSLPFSPFSIACCSGVSFIC